MELKKKNLFFINRIRNIRLNLRVFDSIQVVFHCLSRERINNIFFFIIIIIFFLLQVSSRCRLFQNEQSRTVTLCGIIEIPQQISST